MREDDLAELVIRVREMECLNVPRASVEQIRGRLVEVIRVLAFAWALLAEGRGVVRGASDYRTLWLERERLLAWPVGLALGHWDTFALSTSRANSDGGVGALCSGPDAGQIIDKSRELLPLLVF